MKFKFNFAKNNSLLKERGINFDDIADLLIADKFIAIDDHPNSTKYPNQKIIYVSLGKEIYVIPCIREKDGTYFLKTIFPSRKARKKFLKHKS